MMIIVSDDEIELLNGKKIKPDEDGFFQPMQEFDSSASKIGTCKICPIYPVCQGNNEFDCDVYGMFSGGNFYLKDLMTPNVRLFAKSAKPISCEYRVTK